jgi:uncharacterized RDD family membrane protein YckC
MSATADLSDLERVAVALERGVPVDDVLDLVDEAIEHATAAGAVVTLVRLAELLAAASLTRSDARGLAVAATRARAAAAALGTDRPSAEIDAAEVAEPPPTALRYSGWWRRVGAFVLDWVVLVSVMAAVPGESDGALLFAVFVLPIAYFAGLHTYGHGRTVGKWVFGIAVCGADGEPVDLGRALGRAVVQCLLSITIIGAIVDSLLPLGDARRRTIHDRAVGTVVVRVR